MKPRTGSAARGPEPAIRYATGPTHVGEVLLAVSSKGICALTIGTRDELAIALKEIQAQFPGSVVVNDPKGIAPILDELRELLAGERKDLDTPLDLRGTPFQQRVWRVMREIPPGETWSYQELARRAGRPKAVRAVGSACARNRIAILVPCHRVVRSDGSLGGYGGGLDRKQALLDLERGRR